MFFSRTSSGSGTRDNGTGNTNTGGGSSTVATAGKGDNTGESWNRTISTGTSGDSNNGDSNSGFFRSVLSFLENIANFCMYLTPFNENFFGYLIIEGLIDEFTEFFTDDRTTWSQHLNNGIQLKQDFLD